MHTQTQICAHTDVHTHSHTHLSLFSVQGKGGKFCHLKPMPQADNYVCFMSVENPGQYISFMGNGAPGVPRNTRETNQEAQFFIRVEVRNVLLSYMYMYMVRMMY